MTPQELLARVALPERGNFLIAISGGLDSAVAAWATTRLCPGRARAIHVNHGTRAADVLASSAAKLATHLGLELVGADVAVGSGASWEGQARAARWAAVEAVRRPDEVVVTGHHRDDLAETTLAHLLRGAGSAGLAAMASERPSVIRPLLELSRDEIALVGQEVGLPFVEDPTNYDLVHTRNMLRHKLIPQLEEEVNPQVSSSLARAAHALAADDEFVDASIGPVSVVRDAWGALKISASLVETSQPAVAARLVRRLLRAARPPYAGTFDEVQTGVDVARGAMRARDISDGWTLEREGPWLVAHRGDAETPDRCEVTIPGEFVFGPLTVRAGKPPAALVRRTSLVDIAAVGPQVVLRVAEPGERIDIQAGSKLIRDVMAEAAIPRRVRAAWPVVEAHAKIAAVVGVRSAPWARGALGEEGVIELTAGESQF